MSAAVLYQEILARVRELRDKVAEPILAGGITHEQYDKMSGRLRGILDCEALIVQAWKDTFEERVVEPPSDATRETTESNGAEVESQLY
jgi:hypothetical protein